MRSISERLERPDGGFPPTRGWATPVPRRRYRKSRTLRIFLKYVRLYCENSSLVGCKYLVERNSWLERFIWIAVHIVIVCILAYMISGIHALYLDTPMVTMVETDYYPTEYLNFPGVAICSVNRISRRSAMELASEIANATDGAYQEILDLFSELGNFYDSTFHARQGNSRKLHSILQQFFKGQYNVTDIMRRLTPRCYSMLLRCQFNGQRRKCSDLFKFRKTQDGFCCVFNYIEHEEEEDEKVPETYRDVPRETDLVEPARVNNLGIENGLTVVLEPFLDDYFYTLLPVTGWKVTIFNPDDYPDTTSGGVSEILVSPLTEAYLELDAVCFYSTEDIRSFPVAKRRCYFHDEENRPASSEEPRDTVYTYSDCIVDCKINDVWKYCGCRPFFYPRGRITKHAHRVCNVLDVPCLDRYKSKWWSVMPHQVQDESDGLWLINNVRNRSWALHCKNCYPACDDVHYAVRSSRSYMDTGFYKSKLMNNINITSQSILHVFFPRSGTIRLKQDVAYRWYELLSYIGGICGVFIGFSLISCVEFAYFLARMLRDLCIRDAWFAAPTHADGRANETPGRALYWHEIGPSGGTFTVRARLSQRF